MDEKNKKIIHDIIEVLKDSFSIILIIIGVILFILSLGLTSIFFDSYEYDYKDDWELMDDWKEKHEMIDEFHLIQGAENMDYHLDIEHKKEKK